MKEISMARLERLEKIAKDTKKEFHYNIHTGEWAWSNRDEKDWLSGFPTRFDALVDSVFPYLDPVDDAKFMDEYESGEYKTA